MKKRKLLACFMGAMLLISSLAACGSESSSSSQASAAGANSDASQTDAQPTDDGGDKEPVTLVFLRTGTDEHIRKVYEDLIAQYEADNPHITIDYQEVGWGGELETKLNTMYASGNAPDLVRAPISTVALRASMGQYAALDEYIDAWDEKDIIIPNAYDVATYQGTRYGIAIAMDADFLIYRRDHFIEAGLDPDAPPTTWEELQEYAEALTQYENGAVSRMGLSLAMDSNKPLIAFSRQNGATLVDEVNAVPTFNDDKVVEALEYLVSYRDKDLLIPFTSMDTEPFEAGRASMIFGTLGIISTLQANEADWVDELMFAEIPGREQQSVFGGCQVMYMSEDGKNKDEAWSFMQYLFSKEAVWTLVDLAGAAPVRSDLREQFVEENPVIGPVYLAALNYSGGMPKVEWASLFDKYMQLAVEEAMYGKKDARTSLEDAYNLLLAEIG